jgi:hypothetical protein
LFTTIGWTDHYYYDHHCLIDMLLA